MKFRDFIFTAVALILMVSPAFGQTSGMFVDHVDGLTPDGKIGTNDPVTFHIRLSNHTGSPLYGVATGFSVCSPDGAEWTNTVMDSIPGIIPLSMLDGGTFMYNWSVTGNGCDTVWYGGVRLFQSGIPDGFDEIICTIAIGPVDSMYVGKTICLDSTGHQNGSPWEWYVDGVPSSYVPAWDGPHYYEIVYSDPLGDDNGITLDHVDGLTPEGDIPTGTEVTYYFRMSNYTGDNINGCSHGFVISSPDGAEWTAMSCDTVWAVTSDMFDGFWSTSISPETGSGADTAGVGGFRLFTDGIVDGFDEVIFKMTIGPIDSMYAGKTIVLDSTFMLPSNWWMWSLDTYGNYVPPWDGPHSYDIVYVQPPDSNAMVYISQVDGMVGDDSIAVNTPITFHINFRDFLGLDMWGFTNGIRVYSPDGAEWNTTSGAFADAYLAAEYMDGGSFVNEFGVTGSGEDTVGFGAFKMFNEGIPTSYNSEVFNVTIGPIDPMYVGKTVCIDSSWYPPVSLWLWSLEPNGDSYAPYWEGPRCYTISDVVIEEGDDSLLIPSISTHACESYDVAQPVALKLTQLIKGATIPISIPEGVTVCSLSTAGLITDSWDWTFKQVNADSGFCFVALANSFGATLPDTTVTVFNIFFKTAPLCEISRYLSWDTTLSWDAARALTLSSTENYPVYPGFDPAANATEILGYIGGDINGDGVLDVSDLTCLVGYMFEGNYCVCTKDAGDVNNDCHGPDISDLTYYIDWLFAGGPLPQCVNCDVAARQVLKPSEEVFVDAVYGNNVTTIYLNSRMDLRGVQLGLRGSSNVEPVNLVGERLDVISGENHGLFNIGLLDMDGTEIIARGDYPIVQLPGQYELVSATVSDRQHTSIMPMINSGRKGLPTEFALEQNYPNPFNPITEINFSIPIATDVKLEIYNVMGQKVATLVNDRLEAGYHTAAWDGGDVASGVYFYRLKADSFVQSRKMMLLK